MSKSFALTLASVALLAGCSAGVPVAPPPDGTSSEASSNGVSLEQDNSTGLEAAATRRTTTTKAPAARTVDVVVDNWSFTPSSIPMKKGETVAVRLTAVAGMHSFSVPELGINQRIEAGQTVTVMIPTDRAGAFSFRCAIPCGSGHRDMKGTLVVQP
ncbi:cupredoxin domain-containing protein [Candidatus Peregrinibacteria bacterium]|nr:cupredoxin domain-containing protein [Candidatus Peregrinibacteria bacterium]